MKFKGVLFDYGHTLVWFPHYRQIHRTSVWNIQRKLRAFGVSAETSRIQALIEEFAHQRKNQRVGIEAEFREILSVLGLKHYSEDDLQEIIQLHWHPYVQDARARKGARDLLNSLRSEGFKLGIVANIWSGGMEPALDKLDLNRYFDAKIASVDVGYQKPEQEIFRLALKCLNLKAEETIMVGDNPSADIRGADSLGICTVRLMRGPNRTEPDIVTPDFKIRNLAMLSTIVCK